MILQKIMMLFKDDDDGDNNNMSFFLFRTHPIILMVLFKINQNLQYLQNKGRPGTYSLSIVPNFFFFNKTSFGLRRKFFVFQTVQPEEPRRETFTALLSSYKSSTRARDLTAPATWIPKVLYHL